MELSVQLLVQRLCNNIAIQKTQDPLTARNVSSKLFDKAFSILIGLEPETNVEYIAPESRSGHLGGALQSSCEELAANSFPELANTLQSLFQLLKRYFVQALGLFFVLDCLGHQCEVEPKVLPKVVVLPCCSLDTAAILGTQYEELTGKPFVFPLTETTNLLSFLVALHGSQLSVLRRQVTFQTAHENCSPNIAAPLSLSIFQEMPDPNALINVSSTVALLPSECGNPTDPFAGASDVQDLSSCMSARPVWDPTATAYAPPPPSASWLPVPAPLVEMQSDPRRGARPRPLGVPWSVLSTAREPGSGTMFQALATNDGDLEREGLSGTRPGVAQAISNRQAGAQGRAGQGGEKRVVGNSCGLWTLEEADLAKTSMLALQGVHSALLQLQGVLAVPLALPRSSIAGILDEVAAAADLRQRLQLFVASHQAPGACRADMHAGGSAIRAAASWEGSAGDPVLRAFAAAVGEVLRWQVATLQALEQRHSMVWVSRQEVWGKSGKQFHCRGLTLLQVVLHTGRVRAQLQSLAALCWCLPQQQQAGGAERQTSPNPSLSEGPTPAEPPPNWDAFPRGAALLAYLHQALQEADDSQLVAQRFLFSQAMRPYLAHIRSWAFTATPLLPEFATRAEEVSAVCLECLPTEEPQGKAHLSPAVPAELPEFLRPMQAAFMRTGAQLRLLDTLPQGGRQLAAQLAGIAQDERSSWAPEPQAQLADAGAGIGEHSWLGVGQPGSERTGREAPFSQDTLLQVTVPQLHRAAKAAEAADVMRQRAIQAWLQDLTDQRQLAEEAAIAYALGKARTFQEQQLQAAARRAEAAAQRNAHKSQLFREQSDDVAARRKHRADERARELAEDRARLAQAAVRDHSAEVAKLAAALRGSTLAAADGPGAANAVTPALPAGPRTSVGDEVAVAPRVDAPPAHSSEEQGGEEAQGPALQEGASIDEQLPPASAAALGAGEAQTKGDDCIPGNLPSISVRPLRAESLAPLGQCDTHSTSHQQRMDTYACDEARGPAPAEGVEPLPAGQPAADPHVQPEQAQHGTQQDLEGRQAGRLRPAPLSAVLEAVVVQPVMSQYRAVSQACVRYFLEDLKVLEHLYALRRIFFMGAGDWAEAFVASLTAHVDTLEPLSQHQLERMMQDALRGTSLEHDPYAARMRVRLLPGLSTVTAQVAAVSLPSPQRHGRGRNIHPTSLVVPPSSLDGLDCVALDYDLGWPLSAVITEDTLQGYAAVFSMLVRLKRTEQMVRALHAPLRMQPKSTTDLLLGVEEQDRAYRRLQRLRGFRHGAAQLVAAVQAFLHSRISGEAWVHMLAKLMISSEQVAVEVLSRGRAASVFGVLSRMSSLGASGSAAHQVVKLAKSLSRQGSGDLSRHASRNPSRQSSPRHAAQPRPPRPDAPAARSRLGPSHHPQPAAEGRAGAVGIESVASSGANMAGAVRQGAEAGAQRWGGREQEGGIADLQELLDLHRLYLRKASSDCLTFGGDPGVRAGVDAALQRAMDFVLRLQAAVRLGSAGREEGTWVQVLRRDATWGPLEQSMAAFHAAVRGLLCTLRDSGPRGALAELALQLDFSGFHARQQLGREGRAERQY